MPKFWSKDAEEERTDKQRGMANPAINAFGVAPNSFMARALSRDAFQTGGKKRNRRL